MSSQSQTRRGFLKMIGLGAAALAVPSCAGAGRRPNSKKSSAPPNIVLIMDDDMGFSDI